MRITCPFCGARGLREFSFLGDADGAGAVLPDAVPDAAGRSEADRVYLRANPAGRHTGLWYHEAGCRSWLVVERDTRTHEIFAVTLARRETA